MKTSLVLVLFVLFILSLFTPALGDETLLLILTILVKVYELYLGKEVRV